MKNKFFPTFEQDIGSTLMLCVITISVVIFTAWGVYEGEKALKKAYHKIEADVFKQYADGQRRQAIEDAKSSFSPPPPSAKGKEKRVKHLPPSKAEPGKINR